MVKKGLDAFRRPQQVNVDVNVNIPGEVALSAAVETYRGTVFPWACDQNGHMNVRYYVAKFDEGTWQFMTEIELPRAEMQRRNIGAMAVNQTIDYKRELLAGDTVAVATDATRLGGSSIRFRHRMRDTATGEAVAEMSIVGVFVDLATRKAAAMPEEVRRRGAGFSAEAPA
jgi:acyl-CoA thioester hydrolase